MNYFLQDSLGVRSWKLTEIHDVIYDDEKNKKYKKVGEKSIKSDLVLAKKMN